MKIFLSKIALFIVITGFLASCNSVKRVPANEHLLTKNIITVNDKVNKTETINNLLYQRPNRKLARIPLRLYIYNSARPNIDSIINAGIDKKPKKREHLENFLSKKQLDKYVESRINFNKWLKKTGEAPVIIDDNKTEKSTNRLEAYYFNNGWFNVKATSETEKEDNQKAEVSYFVKTGEPYIIDSLSTKILSPVVDSLYKIQEHKSLIKSGKQYKTATFENEKNRITDYLRNSGVYHFSEDYVFFEMDTINTNKKVNVELQIENRAIRIQDTTIREPFKIYNIKDVNIYPDFSYSNRNKPILDSTTYKGYNLYSYSKLRHRPKALTDVVFIKPNDVFKDSDRTDSYQHISELRTFKYPNIEYVENPDTTLTANIYLTPLKKFQLGFSTEVSQSNIQAFGVSLNPSLLMRNIFRGAETLEISAFGSIGASKDASNGDDRFFDIQEMGVNLNLTFPRIFFLFNTEKIIPKNMSPSTRISLSTSSQTNVGLDKQTFTGAFNYKWRPSNTVTNRFDLFNIQYVRNLNPSNYFNVYQNSFNTLNDIATNINYVNPGEPLNIPDQAQTFINESLSNNPPSGLTTTNIATINNIEERRQRLTENNLIFATSYSFIKDKRENLYDEDFSIFRFKLESAGNFLTAISKLADVNKNIDGNYELFNVVYSQYIKTELDYIKHWDIGRKNVLAIRAFGGIAIPYGNSNSIPFSKSFFAGGPNDNRAWSAYRLGPGRSNSNNEFNEANLKLAFNVEHRFNIFEDLHGALFIDAGNIWNALDNVEDDKATFDSFSALEDIAVGSGFGFRYDFGFVVFRFDIGFKTYDPSYGNQNRWFNDYNFRNAVYNIGINYPF
ncbi:BamA/TamA family outer membrane protein [Corallibacter vietnamensis]|uniref:BamA/TamA family outer membrane protein n=1 Tax=Corallibacter vietnamensis TaxID=904130 RepID=A0ABP7GX62_9FLAO